MPPLTLDQLTQSLQEYYRQTGHTVDLLLIGGLALQAYGYVQRVTVDVDGELVGQFEPLLNFLQQQQIPADLSENISGRSIVAMPPGYRDRTSIWYEHAGILLRLLDPVDFIIAKLRRGIDQDLDDAAYIATQFQVTARAIQTSAEAAIAASPKDTVIFLFKKTIELFCHRLQSKQDR